MLTVKDLKKLLKKYTDDTVVLLYDANKARLDNIPNSSLNSFENILPCHLQTINIEGKDLLAKPSMINEDTGEIVWGFVAPNAPDEELNKGVKAIFISPDSLDFYESNKNEKN